MLGSYEWVLICRTSIGAPESRFGSSPPLSERTDTAGYVGQCGQYNACFFRVWSSSGTAAAEKGHDKRQWDTSGMGPNEVDKVIIQVDVEVVEIVKRLRDLCRGA